MDSNQLFSDSFVGATPSRSQVYRRRFGTRSSNLAASMSVSSLQRPGSSSSPWLSPSLSPGCGSVARWLHRRPAAAVGRAANSRTFGSTLQLERGCSAYDVAMGVFDRHLSTADALSENYDSYATQLGRLQSSLEEYQGGHSISNEQHKGAVEEVRQGVSESFTRQIDELQAELRQKDALLAAAAAAQREAMATSSAAHDTAVRGPRGGVLFTATARWLQFCARVCPPFGGFAFGGATPCLVACVCVPTTSSCNGVQWLCPHIAAP